MNRDQADALAIAAATGFQLTRFFGRARYANLGTFATLAEARAAKIADGCDEHGRPAMIYALTPGRISIFVE